jgi:hypothetical protein
MSGTVEKGFRILLCSNYKPHNNVIICTLTYPSLVFMVKYLIITINSLEMVITSL